MKCYVVLIEIEPCSIGGHHGYDWDQKAYGCWHQKGPIRHILHHTCSMKPGIARSYVTQVKNAGRRWSEREKGYRTGNAFVIEIETDFGVKFEDGRAPDSQGRYEALETINLKVGEHANQAKQAALEAPIKRKRKHKA